MRDSNTGFICGDMVGGILKTTNSGANWINYSEPTGDGYGGISFTDANTGITVGPPGIVLRTTNGGLNWNVISRPSGDMGAVQFVSPNTIYAVGDAIIKSIDGGLTWTQIRSGSLSQYQGVYFIDDNTGTVVGRPGLILTTTNGGSTWQQRIMYLPVQFGDSTLADVKYINSNVGFTCGNNGIFMKTTNGGINWTYYATGAINSLQGISFLDINTGYAAGNGGRIIKTTNGGINWVQQTSNTTTPLSYIDFVDINTGWVVGFNGTILKTTNGGITGFKPISNETPTEYKLKQNYPNPFNPATRIQFSVPLTKGGNRGLSVKLVIYNILGQEVETLVNEEMHPGTYEVNWNAANMSSGIYFYSLLTSNYNETKKMILIK